MLGDFRKRAMKDPAKKLMNLAVLYVNICKQKSKEYIGCILYNSRLGTEILWVYEPPIRAYSH